MINLVKKDLKLFFGNIQDLLLTFAIPIIFITLFTYIFGNMGNPAEGNKDGLIHVVSGISVMMLLFSVAGIGGSLLEEKESGMLKKLLSSPLRTNYILYSKMLFANIISVAQLVVMFSYAWLVFGLNILNYLPSIIIMILAIAYACSSFGIVLASFAKSRKEVQGFSTIIVFVMSAIGGSMIPLFVMPLIIQKIAVVSVNYWGIQGFYDIFLKNIPLTDFTFISKVLVLLGIGTFLNVIAFQMFKRNILKLT